MSAREAIDPVIVVGAGAAGLGVAAELQRRRIPTTILDAVGVAASWRRRYPSLILNNDRWSARLSGARMKTRRWPARDDYVEYLDRFAAERDLRVKIGVEVERIEPDADGWLLRTSAGTFGARIVIVCTGHDRLPVIPPWPGRDAFAGRLMHAADFRRAEDFAARDVLVVGIGTSGTEIAVRLAGIASRVRVAVRSVPNFMPAEFLRVPVTAWARVFQSAPRWLVDRLGRTVQRLSLRDLTELGLPPPSFGVATELNAKGMGPVIDRGFLDRVRSGSVGLVAAVDRLGGDGVRLTNGARLEPEVIIAATGYSSGLEGLVGHLGVLGPRGEPRSSDPRIPAAPGLYLHGYRLPLSGELSGMRQDAPLIAKAIASAFGRAAR